MPVGLGASHRRTRVRARARVRVTRRRNERPVLRFKQLAWLMGFAWDSSSSEEEADVQEVCEPAPPLKVLPRRAPPSRDSSGAKRQQSFRGVASPKDCSPNVGSAKRSVRHRRDWSEDGDYPTDEDTAVEVPPPLARPSKATPAPAIPQPQPPPKAPVAQPPQTKHAAAAKQPLGSASGLTAVVHHSLNERHSALAEALDAAECAHAVTDVAALPLHSVHWVRRNDSFAGPSSSSAQPTTTPLPRMVVVWPTAEIVRAARASTLLQTLAQSREQAEAWMPGCALSLVACGHAVPGLDAVLSSVTLELGASARRALNDKELADLLSNYTAALTAGCGGPSSSRGNAAAGRLSLGGSTGAAFLAGLTASDVLHNRGVPKNLRGSWLCALQQVLPEAAAAAVAEQFPTLCRLQAHLLEAGEGGIQDVRVGAKRLGPVRSKRLYRVLTSTDGDEVV